MSKLKLVWENNPDTPLSASNLSKIVREYIGDNLLYIDTDGFINNADNQLKLRANSKIAVNTNKTIAFFNFNNSLISHNSKYSATTATNVSFRKETPLNIGNSIALETQTINKVTNPNFINELDNWVPYTEGNANIDVVSGGLYGENCIKFSLSDNTPLAKISQEIQFDSTVSDDYNKNISISFYYKSENELNVLVVGKPNSAQPVYWNNSEDGLRWEVQEDAAIISLSPVNDWTRVEIKNIRTDTIWPDNNIKLSIYSNQENTNNYIDAVQVEEKEFCTSFTENTRNESILKYSYDIMRLKKGQIDIEFLLKKLNSEKNVILKVLMNPQFNSTLNKTFTDAMRLEFDSLSSTLSFYIYDTITQTEKQLSRTFSSFAFSNLIDNWQRLILSWDSIESFIKFTLNSDDINITNQSFTPIDTSELINIELGGEGTFKFEGLISSLKFNLFPKTSDEMILDSSQIPYSDNNEYKVFEVSNENIIINNDLLDSGTMQPSTEYYVYFVDDEGEQEEVDIVVSESNIAPENESRFFSYMLGGFKTDSNNTIINESLWDKKTKQNSTIMTERFIVHGEDSKTNNIEFRSQPYGSVDDAKFNIPTYFTNNLYAVTGNTNFLDINPLGYMTVDNVKIDGNIIESINSDLVIKSPSGKMVQIESDNIDINTISGDIHLDGLRIKGQQLRASSGTNITLANDAASSEVIVNSYNGISRIQGSLHINEALSSEFNGPLVTIQAAETTQINSGTTPIYFDNISISGNTLSSKSGGDLHLTSPTQVQVDGPIRINQDELRFLNYNGQKLILDDTVGLTGLGMQASSMYFRTNNHYVWYRQGIHSDTQGDPGVGGSAMALLTGNDQTKEQLGITLDPLARFYGGRVHNAIWNDYAECWPKDGQVEYGQVVYRTEKGVMPTTKRAQKATIGIVSNTYGHLLGDEGFDPDLKKSKVIPIGLAGRLKVIKKGKVEIGDEVVSYKNGRVIKASWFEKIFKRDRIVGIVDSILDDNYCWIKVG